MAHELLCWDIVMEGICRRKEFAGDISSLELIKRENQWDFRYERTLDNCLVWENKVIIVTDPTIRIVLATRNIFEMNGYRPAEIIGFSPKLFQGPLTDVDQKKMVAASINDHVAFQTTLINYRKDGSLYRCSIEAYPVFNRSGLLVNFIAFENTVYG